MADIKTLQRIAILGGSCVLLARAGRSDAQNRRDDLAAAPLLTER